MTTPTTTERFLQDVLRNRHNRAILERWDALALPDGWLVAGCLFQTVWNVRSGQPPEAHIKDYDLFYFDASDLGEEAERVVQRRVDAVLGDLGVVVEVKNQARVHLWYEAEFGFPYPRLGCTRDGIDRFLVSATCVAVRPGTGGVDAYSPNGLVDLYAGYLRPNALTDHRGLFLAKARSYRERWRWLAMAE